MPRISAIKSSLKNRADLLKRKARYLGLKRLRKSPERKLQLDTLRLLNDFKKSANERFASAEAGTTAAELRTLWQTDMAEELKAHKALMKEERKRVKF